MADADQIPHFDVDILPESLEKDFEKILQQLRPEWKKDVVFEALEKDISKGLLNTMVKCHKKDEKDDTIMIRIHNTKMGGFIKRSVEVTCIKYFMKKHCAPNILATFKNGFCYEFIQGEILNSNRIQEEPIWKLIAEDFAKFHSGDIVDGETLIKECYMKKIINDIWNIFPTDLPDPELDQLFKRELPPKEELQAEIEMLMEQCDKLKSPIVLCHNDNKGENIIWNAELGKVTFVDFEMMNYNYQASEIAFHFLSYCGTSPPDYSRFPSEEFQKKWLRHYLEKYNHYIGSNRKVTDKDVQKLYIQVKKFALFGLFWIGVGGLVMVMMNMFETNKLQLLEVCLMSSKEYYKLKDEILKIPIPE